MSLHVDTAAVLWLFITRPHPLHATCRPRCGPLLTTGVTGRLACCDLYKNSGTDGDHMAPGNYV